MIILRNVLLTLNGLFLLLGIPVALGGNVTLLRVQITILMVYLVLDFFYLSLTYPRRTVSEYLALFRGDASTIP